MAALLRSAAATYQRRAGAAVGRRPPAGAELNLLVVRGGRRLGFELKRTDAPRLTPSIRTALADLKLDRLDVIHAGEHTFPLAERVRAVALGRLYEDLEPL